MAGMATAGVDVVEAAVETEHGKGSHPLRSPSNGIEQLLSDGYQAFVLTLNDAQPDNRR